MSPPSPSPSTLPSSSTSGLSTFPLEILIQIIDRAAAIEETWERGRLAARLCLVSKLLLSYAQDLLYRAPNIDFMSIARNRGTSIIKTESNSPLLRRTLAEAPHLASLVRRFDIWTEVSTEPLRRCARTCGTVKAELALLFALPLRIRSLELNDREAFPGRDEGADVTEGMAEAACSHAVWLDQLEELKMECSGDHFSRLLEALPNLQRLSIPLDLMINRQQVYPREELAVPLLSYEQESSTGDIFWQCLAGSRASLRHLTVSAHLLYSDSLDTGLQRFQQLQTVYVIVDNAHSGPLHFQEVASVLADIPTLGTLRLSPHCGVPSELPPSVHTLQLDDPYYNVSNLVDFISGDEHGLRRLELIRSREEVMEWEELIMVCEGQGVDLRLA